MAPSNLIVTGVPRAGKTILSSRIASEAGLNHLHGDSIIDAFAVFPSTGIRHDGESLAETAQALYPYLSRLLARYCHYEIPFVADTYHVQIKDIVKLREELGIQLVYLGYPNIEPAEKLSLVRAYSVPSDWARNESDANMLKLLARWGERSKLMQDECAKYNVKYVDTSNDFCVSIETAVDDLLGKERSNDRRQRPLEISPAVPHPHAIQAGK